jgi:lysophospholipase L1-like esterase
MIKKYLFCIIFISLIFCNINAKTFVGEHGRLHIEGTQLVDKTGKPIVLRGVSLGEFGSCSRFYNKNVVKWLQSDWKINVIRVTITDVDLHSINDISTLYYYKKSIENVVDAAIKQGIYVIVSFHSKNINTAEAVHFFDEISKKYAKYPNIIYEIFNESDSQSQEDFNLYIETVIAAIRANDVDNVIITNYMHLYLDVNFSYKNTNFEQTEISWIAQSISDQEQTNSMLLPTASSKGKWKMSDLREWGAKTREYLRESALPKDKNNTVQTIEQQPVEPNILLAKTNVTLTTMGRTETLPDGNVILIGAASMVEFSFSQKEDFDIEFKSLNGKYAYVSVELDGNYAGRKRIDAQTTISFSFADTNIVHNLKIFKATEATTGDIEVVIPKNLQFMRKDVANSTNKKIEFIGNSITSGMSNDLEIPCNKNEEWYDQHNAYFSYATQLALALGVDFQLSSVSGIGMYRNWNDEHQTEAIMPDVYENLYLNTDKSKPYKFEFKPDIISICLGTNDLSDGDGKKPRLPFNSKKFVENYINFIKMLYVHNPNTQIVLLNSPMVSADKRTVLNKCLDNVKAAFAADKTHKEIKIFHFSDKINLNGCGYHPDIKDDIQMKNELLDFFKEL